MPQLPICEHRRVELGRLYCDIATRKGERATNETFNPTCELCRVAAIRAAHPCAHLDIGVDLTEHRERSTLDAYHLACRVIKADVGDALECTPQCPYFEPLPEEKRREYETAAQQRERAREQARAEELAARGPGRRLDL